MSTADVARDISQNQKRQMYKAGIESKRQEKTQRTGVKRRHSRRHFWRRSEEGRRKKQMSSDEIKSRCSRRHLLRHTRGMMVVDTPMSDFAYVCLYSRSRYAVLNTVSVQQIVR